MVELSLEPDEVLRILGPARIEVIEGSILVVGATYSKGSTIIIHRLRSYALKSISKSRIKVVLGTGGTVEKPEPGDEVINDWLRVAEEVFNDGGGTVVIIGPVESGKTTLTAFLANYFIERGRRACIIEADIGQEDLAVPGTIAMAIPNKRFIWQRELLPDALEFVGCISPLHCQSTIIPALIKMLDTAKRRSPDLIVINTDGWVGTKQAIDYKVEILRWVKPTHVLVLDDGVIYENILNSMRTLSKVLKVPPPKRVRERDRSERRSLRSEAYRRYFEKSKSITLNLNSVSVLGSVVLGGRKVKVDELVGKCPSLRGLENSIVFTSIYGNCLNIVLSHSIQTPKQVSCQDDVRSKYFINVVNEEEFKGILIGLYNDEGKCLGLGIIESIDFEKGVIKVRSPCNEKISYLVFGKLKILSNFEDLPRVARCGI